MAGYPKTQAELREIVLAECESVGEAEVRGRIELGSWAMVEMPFVREWLTRKEALNAEEQRSLDTRAVAAAERAATASEHAAESSREAANAARSSARWTFWAAIIALLSVGVSVIPGCIQNL